MPQLSKNRTKNSGAELGQSLRESRDTGKTAGCSWVPAESEAGRDSLGAQTVKRLPWQTDSLPSEPPGKPFCNVLNVLFSAEDEEYVIPQF